MNVSLLRAYVPAIFLFTILSAVSCAGSAHAKDKDEGAKVLALYYHADW